METAILVCIIIGLSILVYISYTSIEKTEKAKQAQFDQAIATDWEELEAEISKED